MMKLLDLSKKYLRATYKYPFEPYHVNEGFRGKPVYTHSLCIGCTACAVVCPPNAINLKLNDDKNRLMWLFDCGRCIFCGRCDEVCPTNAIMLSEEFEVAVVFDKNALKIEAELEVENCKVCGKPFTTKRLIEYTKQRLEKTNFISDTLSISKINYLLTCDSCKNKSSAEKSVISLASTFTCKEEVERLRREEKERKKAEKLAAKKEEEQ
ncbi:MAG: formate hydrogenlyase complex iron-sulfur subunit [Campylobacteraceae bacterium]